MTELFLAVPDSGAVYALSKQGKTPVPFVPLERSVTIKVGPHLVEFVGRFDIDPTDINLHYYDGGDETYRILMACLVQEESAAKLGIDDFQEKLQTLCQLLGLSAPATLFAKCRLGEIYRITFNPTTRLLEVVRIELPMLFDDHRQGDFVQLCVNEDERHRLRVRRLIELFDINATTAGADSFADLFTSRQTE